MDEGYKYLIVLDEELDDFGTGKRFWLLKEEGNVHGLVRQLKDKKLTIFKIEWLSDWW